MNRLPVARVALIPLALQVWVSELPAQDPGFVSGTVVELSSGLPLAGVTVTIPESSVRTTSDEAGHFDLWTIETGMVLIRLELAGYATTVEKLEVGAARAVTVEFRMVPIPTVLDELIVSARRRQADSGKAVVEPTAEMADLRSSPELADFLDRVTGVGVLRPTADRGTGPRLLIRGVSSIAFKGEPVVFIDGIRVSDPTAAPGSSWRVLDNINPTTIDRVEIVKGPAASVHYGTGSVSGVILIYTMHRSRSPPG